MNDDRLKELLSAALPPVDVELKLDLWPRIKGRAEARPTLISRLDWALITAVTTWVAIFPQSLMAILYHL